MKQDIKPWHLAIAACFIGLLVWGLIRVSFQDAGTMVAKPVIEGDLVTSRTPDALELELIRRDPAKAHLFPTPTGATPHPTFQQ